jgi:hypothetical protein
LILRKNFRGITFFASSETPISVIGLKIHNSRCHKNIDSSILNSANLQSFKEKIGYLKSNVCILRRIPRGARISVANKLNKVISDCVSLKNFSAWEDLFLFTFRVLHIPSKNAKGNGSLTTTVKKNAESNTDFLNYSKTDFSKLSRFKLVENKVADDIKGAVRILSSDDTFAKDK